MLDLSSWVDLPLIWGGLISIAIVLYVLLDGFDLGIGILFPFAPSDKCRNRMMSSIAPFWDGNETWLVLGGGGLFAAFPLAYSIVMPAFYIPIILMLLGLIFRGTAFEFRFKAQGKQRILWDYAFHFGSLLAAFMQGMILGGFIQGIEVRGRAFAGGPFDWLNAFSVMTGIAVVFGYALQGSAWLVMKTENSTQVWARKTASYVLVYVGFFLALVSLSMPYMNEGVATLWFTIPNFFWLMPIPLITLLMFVFLWRDLHTAREIRPFILSQGIFILGFIGLGFSLWPWVVPFKVTLWEAAAAAPSQSLLLIGALIMLPIILAYTGYSYYVFRGKASHEAHY
ncbi:MAG: cytochrome d ubiquinol oxidase subunit II [Gammaproteobacteria bacterium]